MNPIIWVAAGIAGLFVVDAKVKPLGLAKYNPLGSTTAALPATTKEGPNAIDPKNTNNAPVPSVIPSTIPGVPVIDGHGTGVIPDFPGGRPSGLPLPSAPRDPIMEAAKKAANDLQMQIVNALNTKETDRTPEQLALLAGVASLPTLS